MSFLQFGAVYLVLYARDDPEKPHWALYHRYSSDTERGFKYHIRNLGEGWIADFSDLTCSGISKEFLLIGFIHIATITSPISIQLFHHTVTSHPYNDPGTNCWKWLVGALEKCISKGLVSCPDVDQLLFEAFSFGSGHWEDATNAIMPRPVITSSKVFINVV